MSISYNVFVGPYLEVHNPIQETKEKRKSCPKAGCSNNKKLVESPFCPKCGEKVRHIDVPTKGRKTFNIYDEFPKERLTEFSFEGMPDEMENYMLFHSNMDDCDGNTFCDTTEVVPMEQNTPNAQIEEFAKYFSKEIERIAEVFGKPAVKIKWGVISYWY